MKSKKIANVFIEKNPDLNNQEVMNESLAEMLKTFMLDLEAIISNRNVQLDVGIYPIIRELNQKWNSVRKKLHDHYGRNVLIKDGFLIHLKHNAPVAYEGYMKEVSR